MGLKRTRKYKRRSNKLRSKRNKKSNLRKTRKGGAGKIIDSLGQQFEKFSENLKEAALKCLNFSNCKSFDKE